MNLLLTVKILGYRIKFEFLKVWSITNLQRSVYRESLTCLNLEQLPSQRAMPCPHLLLGLLLFCMMATLLCTTHGAPVSTQRVLGCLIPVWKWTPVEILTLTCFPILEHCYIGFLYQFIISPSVVCVAHKNCEMKSCLFAWDLFSFPMLPMKFTYPWNDSF